MNPVQDAIRLPAEGLTPDEIHAYASVIAQLAQNDHAQWPQYAGHWSARAGEFGVDDGELAEGWRPVVVTRRIKTKLGVAFEAGDFTIARTEEWEGEPMLLAYSWRNRIDTGVKAADIKNPLGGLEG